MEFGYPCTTIVFLSTVYCFVTAVSCLLFLFLLFIYLFIYFSIYLLCLDSWRQTRLMRRRESFEAKKIVSIERSPSERSFVSSGTPNDDATSTAMASKGRRSFLRLYCIYTIMTGSCRCLSRTAWRRGSVVRTSVF